VNSFHGRTVTTISATGQDSFHQFFFPFTEGFLYAEANNIKSVLSKLNNTICAVMIEIVQGEGGVLTLQKKFLKELEAVCKQKDVLLIVDEVQTGVGRTGEFLASEHFDISPDIVTLAKGLAGGLPIGAVLCNEKLSKVLGKGHHGSTFGANPVSCAAAVEVLKRIGKKGFYGKVLKRAKYIRVRLKEIPQVSNIRGMGLMIGFDLKDIDSKKVVSLLAEKGLLALTAKTSVRFLPPLVISYQEIDEGIEILKSTLKELSK
jgi:acetylornithine/N-succinyldiaminopimelate aminotransferase